tara:strand:- start:4262 stop:4906 length:645 start_codon:yes stop_codon:yes gene_type:complete
MGLVSASNNPDLFLALIIAFIYAITVHEFAHAYVGNLLGDHTPKTQGRITLNPMRHLDPMGTLLLVLAGFGWGKPVLVNPHNFVCGARKGMAYVAIAGPASNLASAAILSPIARSIMGGNDFGGDFFPLLIFMLIQVNILLAIFNMIPVPPLDGFSVLLGIVDRSTAIQLESFRKHGPIVLIALLFVGPLLGVNFIGQLVGQPTTILVDILING